MRLRNATDIPDEVIRDVIRFVRPSGVTAFDVRVGKSSGGDKGKAYTAGSSYHDRDVPFVNVYIDPATTYPKPQGDPRSAGFGYLPRPWVANATEMLVYLMAHELRHLWQARVPKGRRVWGSRGQFSERDACAYGIRKLREWRRRPQD